MTELTGNRATWWLRLALGAGAIVAVAWFVEPTLIVAAIADARFGALAFAALLLIPNLWFQFRKWRYVLLTNGYRLTDSTIWQSLLLGFAFGIVTPARVGEFGGRLLVSRALQNKSAPGLVAADKFAAMIVTVSFGLLAAAVWGMHFQWFGIAVAVIVAAIALLFPFIAWRGIRIADAALQKTGRKGIVVRAIRRLSEATRLLTIPQYRMMLLYSTGFYLTFVAQFSILLLGFEEANILFTVLGVSCVMIAKTVVPPVTLGELGVREGFTVFFLAMIGMSAASAFSASLLLFLINILIPSAAGGVLLLRSTFQPRMQE